MAHYRKQCISILVTNKCNINCTYCLTGSAKKSIKTVVDSSFAKKGIADFFDQTPSRHIRFYAIGEPTTEIELIKELSEYAKGLAGDALTIELQTNGCFSKSTAAWIRDNVQIVWVSLDGPPDVHDQLRIYQGGTSSRPLIEKNLSFLLEREDMVIGARPTITSLNVDRQLEMVEYYHRLGVKAVWSHHQFEPVGGAEGVGLGKVARIDLMQMAKSYLVARERAEGLGLFYGNFLAVNFDEKCQYFCRACLPAPHLTPDGYVSCCDMAFNGETFLDELIYGKWDKKKQVIHYDGEALEKIRARNIDNLPECSNCEALANCAGGCLGEALYETGDIFGMRKDHCEAVRYLFRHLPRNSGLYPYNHP